MRGQRRMTLFTSANMTPKPRFEPHPNSAPGDFYVAKGECVTCGFPHVIAPELIGWADDKKSHCIWNKQPQTPSELAQAMAVLEGQEFTCHRYAGIDAGILERAPSGCCDYPLQRSPVQPKSETELEFIKLRASALRRLWTRLREAISTHRST